ncbi:MAG: histidine phosphatase family protein, partial [Sulfolobales archaeon]|nr:histidine phosphatase family protein [Sulfolobales archaeon]
MIELILVRHGDAEPKAEGKDDRERRLVEKGVIQMRRVANLVELLGFRLDRILASPYVRAIQSAQAISEELEDDVKVETIKELEPDQDPSALLNRLRGMDEK